MAEGVVPTSYIETISSTAPRVTSPTRERPESMYSISAGSIGKKKGPAVAPKRGGKKLIHVEALYDYKARTEDEFDMISGDRFVLIADDQGDGWAEVEKNGVKKMVPANYVEKV